MKDKDIDKSDASLGYYAVEPIEGCLECAFDGCFLVCFLTSRCCWAYREDERDVIFIKKADKDE